MFKVETKIFKDELKYNGDIILKYTIKYPQIINNKCITMAENFNNYNYTKALELKEFSEGKLFNDAKETYKYNKENGYPIMVYEVNSIYEITYNSDNILSLYIDDYIFSGGAHGMTNRTSQNWDIRTGEQIKLCSFFPNNPNYVANILTNINEYIEEDIKNGNNIYFENYCCLTAQAFNVNNYYLKDGNIVIYFQQYDIAPYSSGILTFNIKV